jgi:hypothetical protein
MLDDVKIMQFADGTLNPSEREAVKEEIENNSEYKKILEDYIYTGEILNNLGKEIKSKPLPTYLSNKIFEFNKNKVQFVKKKQFNFNFFDIFKIKYSAVAAGFALFFVGGYTTSHYLIADKTDYGNMQEVKGTIDNQPIFRGAKKNIETGLDSSAEFYQIFNIEKFNKEINAKIKNTKNNQKLRIQFSNNNAIELVVGNNFKNNKDQNCKNLNLQKKIKITEINEPVNASISICSQNNEWKFVSINLN